MDIKAMKSISGLFYALMVSAGTLLLASPAAVGQEKEVPAASVRILYYGEMGCSHCDRFASETLPFLEKKFGLAIRLEQFDILDPDIYRDCSKLLEEKGYSFRYFPVVMTGNNVYQGETEISENLEDEISYFAKYGAYRERVESSFELRRKGMADEIPSASKGRASDEKNAALSLSVVFAAGAVDGINPCAFTVLLFFFSYLTLRKKSYGEFLLTGAVFIAAIFTTYLLIGYGFYSFMSRLIDFSAARIALRVAVSVLTALFAALSLADFISLRKNSRGRVLLRLPDRVNSMIRALIRKKTGKVFMAGAVFLTGAAVSVLELACTGQVYLPSIIYMLDQGSGSGMLLLLSYNTGFILPVSAIFLLLAAGCRAEKISLFFNRNTAAAKAMLSAVFIILALSVWFF